MNRERQIALAEHLLAASFIAFAGACVLSISVTQIAFAVGTAAWLYSTYLRRAWGKIRFPLGIAFALFAAASVLSMVFSTNPPKSLYFFKKLSQAAIFFLFLNNLKDPARIKRLLSIIFIVGGLTGLYACLQTYEAGLSLSTRAEGTMSIYMTFAGLAMLNSLMIISFLFFDFSWRRDGWMVLALLFIFLGLGFSLTRSAWVGFLTGIALLVFFKNKKLFFAVPLVLAVLFFTAPDQVRHRAASAFDPSDPTRISRLQMWQTGIAIFKDYPWTGIGFFTLGEISDGYKVAPDQKKVTGLHNNFFQIAVDAGLLGLFSWMAIWILFFFRTAAIYKKSAGGIDPSRRAIILGSAACVAAFLANGFFEVNFYDSEVAMLVYFLMSLPFALDRPAPDPASGSKK